jgi:hypothetical protein
MKLNNLKQLQGGLCILRLLFKEVLQQTSPEIAEKLTSAYKAGKPLMLVMGHDSHDTFAMENKTAFRWVVKSDDHAWREANWLPLDAQVVMPMTGKPN